MKHGWILYMQSTMLIWQKVLGSGRATPSVYGITGPFVYELNNVSANIDWSRIVVSDVFIWLDLSTSYVLLRDVQGHIIHWLSSIIQQAPSFLER